MSFIDAGRRAAIPGDARGVAAVEFAVLLPIIVVLFFGTYEITQVLRLNLKLSHAAGAIAQIIAKQSAPVTPGQGGTLGDICAGAALIMSPFDGSALSAAIASVTNYGGTAKLDWERDDSCKTAATAMGTAGAIAMVTAPANLIPDSGDSIIVVRTTYPYTNVTGLVLSKAFTFNQLSFTRPNNNTTIACLGC